MSDESQQPSTAIVVAWFTSAIVAGIIVSRLVMGLIPIADPQMRDYARSGTGLFVMLFLINGWKLRTSKGITLQLVIALAGAIGSVAFMFAYDQYFQAHT